MRTKVAAAILVAAGALAAPLATAEETKPGAGTKGAAAPASAGPAIVATRLPLPLKPDLIVQNIVPKVRRVEDTPAGRVEYFGEYVTVQNNNTAPAGPFDVLLERSETSSSGPWMACGACKIHVDGLAGKSYKTLDPREFNRRVNKINWFRATVDVDDTVHETNEANNVLVRQRPEPPTHR